MKDAPKDTDLKPHLNFGAYMPQDVAAAVELVNKLLFPPSGVRPAISLETAIAILVEAGLPIRDAVEEVLRIEGRDFKGADDLLTATADEAAVFDYLGRKQPPPPPKPTINVVPGQAIDPLTGQPVGPPPTPPQPPAPAGPPAPAPKPPVPPN
jgi:hypothetical protein